jgi:hypothetical protein
MTSTLCLVLLCSAMFPGSSALAAEQRSALDGTYILDETDSDNMNAVIEDAVGKLNFLTRDIARGRLKKLNPAYRQVAITSSPNEISVTVDNQPPLRTWAMGAPVAWVGPDGRKVSVSMQLADRRLEQTFTSANGRRVNDYTLSSDGLTLTMQVTETSPQLSQGITYKQVYRRVQRMPTVSLIAIPLSFKDCTPAYASPKPALILALGNEARPCRSCRF